MDELLKQILASKQAAWARLLTERAGLAADRAPDFAARALEQVLELLKAGKLDSRALLGGRAEEVLPALDPGGLAEASDLDRAGAERGLAVLLPEIGAALAELLRSPGGGGLKGIVGKLLG